MIMTDVAANSGIVIVAKDGSLDLSYDAYHVVPGIIAPNTDTDVSQLSPSNNLCFETFLLHRRPRPKLLSVDLAPRQDAGSRCPWGSNAFDSSDQVPDSGLDPSACRQVRAHERVLPHPDAR